jgi:translation elongation factor EF-1alpha
MILLDIVATAVALVTAGIVKSPAATAITVTDMLLVTVVAIVVEDILALAGVTVGALVVHMGTVAVRPMVTVVVMAAQAATEVNLVVMEEEEEEEAMVGAAVGANLYFAP